MFSNLCIIMLRQTESLKRENESKPGQLSPQPNAQRPPDGHNVALAGAQAPHPTPGLDCNTQALPTQDSPPDWTAGHSDRHGEGASIHTEENRDGTHVGGWLGTSRFF